MGDTLSGTSLTVLRERWRAGDSAGALVKAASAPEVVFDLLWHIE
jgi:hypothetical protein